MTLSPQRSPAFERTMKQRDWLVAAVYFQPNDIDPEHLLYELKRMRALGFNAVRFYHAVPTETAPGVFDFSRADLWMDTAQKAGMRVILHLEWFFVSDGLLAREGLDRETFERVSGDDPRYAAVLDAHYRPILERYRDHPGMYMWGILGEPDVGPARLRPEDHVRFGTWLAAKYGSLQALDAAWNVYPDRGKPIISAFDEAWRELAGLYSEEKISGVNRSMINYGAVRDFIEFATDHSFVRADALLRLLRGIDPVHAVALGAHQLFASQPLLRWDIPRWAKMGDLFTTSIHLSWHFELVNGEVDRPVYMQARLTRDADKNGWTSCYETTAGPVQYSGGFGNAMTPGLMRRLMLSYLAAGNVNIGFWTWNPRPGGWEAGEYGLIDLAGGLTPWAEEAGRVTHAMQQYHDELWEADDEAEVGILTSWDTDVLLSFEPPRHDLGGLRDHSSGTPLQAQRSRIGAARALIDAHIPFHFLTTDELGTPQAERYRVLYAPHLRTVDEALLDRLLRFVEGGGRLIADVPFGFNDPWGKLLKTGAGSRIDQLFGGWSTAIHDTRTHPRRLGRSEVHGFYADLAVSDARVLASWEDGAPAILEKSFGANGGSAVLIGCDLSRQCLQPGNAPAERLLADLVGAGRQPGWRTSAPLAWRRRCAKADHYFLVNDGPHTLATIDCFDAAYTVGINVLSGETIPMQGTISCELPAESGCWLRFLK
ncbi:MAG: beta-galactosidase [Verrucomicrobia bacterium]|nr:beta-galactosidase [Verrucomicrobiota bacterium]MCH8514509.1 beta-galactosidase [Kiritimatiellia bacterium]